MQIITKALPGVIMSSPKHRDEEKAARKQKRKRKELVESVSNLCDAIMKQSRLWFEPDLHKVREFMYEASSCPHIYPPPQNTSMRHIIT